MKHADIKQHIIGTASNLFYGKGYNTTGINQVISSAGIAKATLYSHFASKNELCLAYLDFKHATFLRDIRNFCAVRENGAAQVLAIFDYLKTLYKSDDFNGCWCINTAAEVPLENSVIHSHIKKLKRQFLTFIKELMLDNFVLLDPTASTSLSRQIYLLYEGAVVESHLQGAEWPIKETKIMCAKILT